MTTPFHISDEAVEAVARVMAVGDHPFDLLKADCKEEYRIMARAVLSSPPVSELVEALEECRSSFLIGNEKSLVDFETVAREFNRRQQLAGAALVPFTAAEKADV